MHKFINCFFSNVWEQRNYQVLDSSDKIEEITEEISDLSQFDQKSRLFWVKTKIDPDFHLDQEKPVN
jgi:hypothetical protein